MPNLGVVRKPNGDGSVFADIPGLITGAAKGIGLGHEFLRHIERTKLLIHLVDVSSVDPIEDIKVIENELLAYGNGLINRPRVLVLNKKELIDEKSLRELDEHFRKEIARNVLFISAAMNEGLDILLTKIWQKLEA